MYHETHNYLVHLPQSIFPPAWQGLLQFKTVELNIVFVLFVCGQSNHYCYAVTHNVYMYELLIVMT